MLRIICVCLLYYLLGMSWVALQVLRSGSRGMAARGAEAVLMASQSAEVSPQQSYLEQRANRQCKQLVDAAMALDSELARNALRVSRIVGKHNTRPRVPYAFDGLVALCLQCPHAGGGALVAWGQGGAMRHTSPLFLIGPGARACVMPTTFQCPVTVAPGAAGALRAGARGEDAAAERRRGAGGGAGSVRYVHRRGGLPAGRQVGDPQLRLRPHLCMYMAAQT